MAEQFDIVVIGGGPAGVTAALRARELGAARVALVERAARLGGTCTNNGCVPTRVLAKAARLVRDAEQFEEYGLEAAGGARRRPAVNLPRLLEQTRRIVDQVHEKKQLRGHLEEAKVAVRTGEARFSDEHTLTLAPGQNEAIRGDRFILCGGGRARRPDFPGSHLALTHDDVWNLDRLPSSLAVVGAAHTGCQIASVMAAFGVGEVTLLDTAPRLLPGEDDLVSQTVAEGFAQHGIRVVTGIGRVDQITTDDNEQRRIHYARNDAPQTFAAHTVLLAMGWPGNTGELGLENAGVTIERGYVLVDDTLQTSSKHIWAAGDITGRMMLVQSASDEARIAAENAVRGTKRRDTHTIVPHGGFTDPEYGSVGKTEEKARASEPDCLVSVVPYAELDRAIIDGRTGGACKLIVSRQTRKILGAHVAGEQALEVVQVVAAGMASGLTIEQLADLELAYPTFAQIIGLAARQMCRELGVVCTTPSWRERNSEAIRWAGSPAGA